MKAPQISGWRARKKPVNPFFPHWITLDSFRPQIIMNNETELPKTEHKDPPKNIRAIISHLGPGLIIAAAIVGAGELIATTKTGADAGFSLLWLIIIGCLIKVFVQIELGRYTVISGKKTIEALNEIPGPRKRVNWIVWYWLVMFTVAIAQLGGVIGGVGQSLAIMFPLTEAGAEYNAFQEHKIRGEVNEALEKQQLRSTSENPAKEIIFPAADDPVVSGENKIPERLVKSRDDIYWAFIVSIITAFILVKSCVLFYFLVCFIFFVDSSTICVSVLKLNFSCKSSAISAILQRGTYPSPLSSIEFKFFKVSVNL